MLARRLALMMLGLVWLGGRDAEAKARKPRIRWEIILVPERKDGARIEALLKEVLQKESKRARWGKHYDGVVDATVKVQTMTTSIEGDVARVTCSAVGKIDGLGIARSRFSYGGRAEQRAVLEKHVLELVARGIITRLAELAREKHDGWKVSR